MHEYNLEQRAQNLDVGPLESIESGLDLYGCATITVGNKAAIIDCVKFVVGLFAEAERQADERVSNIPPVPESAPTKLKYP